MQRFKYKVEVVMLDGTPNTYTGHTNNLEEAVKTAKEIECTVLHATCYVVDAIYGHLIKEEKEDGRLYAVYG